jgi:hypothetical protein
MKKDFTRVRVSIASKIDTFISDVVTKSSKKFFHASLALVSKARALPKSATHTVWLICSNLCNDEKV